MAEIREVAAAPCEELAHNGLASRGGCGKVSDLSGAAPRGLSAYAPNNNLTKLQGRDAYRLRVSDWRVIYESQDDLLVMLLLELGPRGGIY